MDAGRGDVGGGGDMEDEFACAGMLRGSLTSLHASVERIFRVTFGIGTDDLPHGDDGQIWLKLRGPSSNVKAAKLFVKGVVNQEEQQEVSYPGVLHCVFCGARGLFMDSLIKNTSAHIVVGSPGFLLISGLAEPVVRAYSLIADLVERYEGSQSRRSEATDRGSGETLDSRRAFKTLVEEWEDRHILDLLVLPVSVKEILLDLVKESGLGTNPTQDRPHMDAEDRPSTAKTLPDRRAEGQKDSFLQSSSRGTTEERTSRSPQEVGEEEETSATRRRDGRGKDEEPDLSTGKEFCLLLKFFTAMGYTEDVVKRVLARTGPKEASQILDLVQQEQDRSDLEQNSQPKHQDASSTKKNRPCETEHREDEGAAGGKEVEVSNGEVKGGVGGATGGDSTEETEQEEDFVLGVLKKAAASCGYDERNVAKAYNMFPDRSTHELLLELQREGSKETDAFREEPREMDDVVLEEEVEAGGGTELFTPARKSGDKGQGNLKVDPDIFSWVNNPQPSSQHASQKSQISLPEVKGPPMPTYPTSLNHPLNLQSNKQQTVYWPNQPTSTPDHHPNQPTSTPDLHPKPAFKQALQAAPIFTRKDSSPVRTKDRRNFSVVVTGEQRFLEGLQTPFELKLTDKPGDAKLRTIIIDGSNVAMSHGLGHFFSCRGIALAVQHFWDRGHRDISALLPQWRQKSDPRIKEQHYLTELQKVGLVSYTPSREVQGKRISSYDDRLILQLAQKTDGVIVTNDNLRDLSDESAVWRDIIKKRLLQYTFVGDHFMVPDDPLGRGGPHLDDFLRSEHRTPHPGNHSFAGSASAFPPSKAPRSQTEVLNFRDRALGGAVEASGGGGRGRGRGQRRGRQPGGPDRSPDRSPEETAALREQLCQVFSGQDNMVILVLQSHPAERDVNQLSDLILEQQD